MKSDRIVFMDGSFWWVENVPEKPDFSDVYHQTLSPLDLKNAKQNYERALVSAIEKKLPIVNPQLFAYKDGDWYCWKHDVIEPHADKFIKEGELYPWPGTADKIKQGKTIHDDWVPIRSDADQYPLSEFVREAIELSLPKSETNSEQPKLIGRIVDDFQNRKEIVNQEAVYSVKTEKFHDAFQTFEACNWPEDYEHENGNYTNKCCTCNFYFKGNKHRVQCKMCASEEPDWNQLILKKAPDLGGAYAGCWLDGEMTGYARCMVKHVIPLRKAQNVKPEPVQTEEKEEFEEMASKLYDKWALVHEGKIFMTRDLFTLAVHDYSKRLVKPVLHDDQELTLKEKIEWVKTAYQFFMGFSETDHFEQFLEDSNFSISITHQSL